MLGFIARYDNVDQYALNKQVGCFEAREGGGRGGRGSAGRASSLFVGAGAAGRALLRAADACSAARMARIVGPCRGSQIA
jgi:hypothetical protein